MNTLDIVILVLFIPGIVRGMSKGFIEQAISLVGIVLSVYLAFKFSGVACTWLKNYITVSETVLNVLGFAVVLVGVLLIVLFIAKLVTAAVEKASMGWLNKVLGLVFSIAVSALLIGLLIILFDTVNLKFGLVKSPVLQESLLYGALKDFGYFVFPYLKGLITTAS
ncbi:MAG: CvpA family protein [Bacteroidales bacterium]|nr:CvpA family protein [Bacteroidales bacterium]